MKILIAEDDTVTRRLLEIHLKRWGHEVVACADGGQAWQVMRQEDAPKFCLLDWMMPEMNGVDICRELRDLGRQPYVYIILLTSKGTKDDVVEGLEAGADDYIIKPFDPHELKVRVRAGARIVHLQTDLVSALKTAEYQATHDPLTKLWNRAAILKILQKEVARSERVHTPVGVIIADLDHFKLVNDQHGHLTGDAVLREVARTMQVTVRPYDAVGRYGGEEFIVVIPGCDMENAKEMAERLRTAVSANPLVNSQGVFNITMSFGVTSVESGNEGDMNFIIRAADEALYRAKNGGRNRVELSEETLQCLPNERSRPRISLPISAQG